MRRHRGASLDPQRGELTCRFVNAEPSTNSLKHVFEHRLETTSAARHLANAGAGGYALSTTNATITAGGGAGSITVTSASGCAWTANSSAAWIMLTGPTSLAGVGVARFSVAAAGTPRVGRLTVAAGGDRGTGGRSVHVRAFEHRDRRSVEREQCVGGCRHSGGLCVEQLPGQYLVQVWVRSAGSATPYDGWRQATASVSKPGILTVTAVTASLLRAAAGQPVTWTATAAGGTRSCDRATGSALCAGVGGEPARAHRPRIAVPRAPAAVDCGRPSSRT